MADETRRANGSREKTRTEDSLDRRAKALLGGAANDDSTKAALPDRNASFVTIPGYEIVREVSRGGQGVVYQALQESTNRTVAIKVIREGNFGDQQSIDRFQREVRVLAQLRHPNIVTIHDSGIAGGHFYYVMSYISGDPLDPEKLRRELPLTDLLALFASICEAVHAAHERGIVHRDLKPANVLIDSSGVPHVLDFGLAKVIGRTLDGEYHEHALSVTGQFFGSVPWASPEQAEGIPSKIGLPTDVYALGVLLYQLLTGRFPYDVTGGAREALQNIVTAEPARPSVIQQGIDNDVETIVLKCLAKDPARRYPNAGDLARDVRLFLDCAPIEAKRDSRLYVLRKALTRNVGSHYSAYRRAVILVMTVQLSGLFWAAGVRRLEAGFGGEATTVIQFRPSTIEAIRTRRIGGDLPGLSADIPKSWRLLHGELMRVLAEAGPRTVVWDYFVPDCYPEYDQALVRGLDALKAAGIPVVIGASSFDINGKPRGCPEILAAAHSIGALHAAHPDTIDREFVMPICIRHGLSPPVPSLSVAGFAAARFPDSILDLRPEDRRVLACYRRRHFQPGQPEWRTEVDTFDVAYVGRDKIAKLLHRDAEIFYARVNKTATAERDGRIMVLEDVLTASPAQLRSRFAGRVVLVGAALPGTDEYAMADGKTIFGHQVHARALDSFLARERFAPIPFFGLTLRTLLWSVLASALAQLIPVVAGVRASRVILFCLVIFVAGWMVGAVCGLLSAWLAVESTIAACVILVVGSTSYLAKVLRRSLARPE